MIIFTLLLTLALGACHAQAKAVFAHFMVGNTENFQVRHWEEQIALAQDAHIDGFALNMAYGWEHNADQVRNAFAAAGNKAFKLFFSFDYAGGDEPWPDHQVIAFMQQYKAHAAHYQHNGLPLASTFEGPKQAANWTGIKTAIGGCFFVPDWSSLGAHEAVALASGVADGLFSFDAWPDGASDMTTAPDRVFLDALATTTPAGNKTYMMPVSPWFFTNLPGFGKNWLWRGDGLWDLRWRHVLDLAPDYVQILTWNDYGERHYVGPVRNKSLGLFTSARAPFNYVEGMPHEGWLKLLPFYIERYKTGAAAVKEEALVAYYRPNPAAACESGGTTGNNRAFGQVELAPHQLVEDRVFFTALLETAAEVSVSIGGEEQKGTFTRTPADGGAGVYEGSVEFRGNSGEVVVTLLRDGKVVATAEGGPWITTNCKGGIENWNAAVISS